MIGAGVAAQDPKGDVLMTSAFDLAGGADPGAVGVQQHGQQHPGLVGGPAVPIGPIGLEERAKVELVDDVEDEPGQVVGRQPVADIGWEQEGLVAVAGKEVVGHGRSYATSLLCCRLQWPPQQPFLQQALTRSTSPSGGVVADLTGELRAWPHETWAKLGVDPDQVAQAVVGCWQAAEVTGFQVDDLGFEGARSLSRPAMTSVRGQLRGRLTVRLGRVHRRWLHPTSGQPGDRFL
jgi:hypothetical protein